MTNRCFLMQERRLFGEHSRSPRSLAAPSLGSITTSGSQTNHGPWEPRREDHRDHFSEVPECSRTMKALSTPTTIPTMAENKIGHAVTLNEWLYYRSQIWCGDADLLQAQTAWSR